MYIDLLLDTFEKVLRGYPEFPLNNVKETLRDTLSQRKDFDAQDEALIEAILKDKDKLFEKTLVESIDDYINNSGIERKELLTSEEGQGQVVVIFMGVLENLINYYYSALINGQLYSM